MATRRQSKKLFAEVVQAACELVRSNGVPEMEVQELLDRAFNSAYAAPERRAVRELTPISAMSTITGTWHIDKNCVDKLGRPKPLTWNGKRGTLLNFARRIVGNEKARSAVEQLVTRKLLIRTQTGDWLPRSDVLRPRGLDRAQILRAAVMFQRLLRTISHNSSRNYRGKDLLFEVMTRVPRLPSAKLPTFKAFVRAQGMVYVRNIDDWLESRNLTKKKRGSRGSREAGVVVFAFEEPTSDP